MSFTKLMLCCCSSSLWLPVHDLIQPDFTTFSQLFWVHQTIYGPTVSVIVSLCLSLSLSLFSTQLYLELQVPSSSTRTWMCSRHPSWTSSWLPMAGLSTCSVLASASLAWFPSWLASLHQRTPSAAWFSASLVPLLLGWVSSSPLPPPTSAFRSKARPPLPTPWLTLVSPQSPPMDTRSSWLLLGQRLQSQMEFFWLTKK